MYVKGNLRDIFIYVGSRIRLTLNYEVFRYLIIKSFIFIPLIVCIHLLYGEKWIIILITNKQGGFISWIEKL